MDFRTYFGGGVERTTTSTSGKFINNGINYPSPKLTLTLTSQLGQNDGLGEG